MGKRSLHVKNRIEADGANPTVNEQMEKISPLAPRWKGASIVLLIIALCLYFIQGYFVLGTRSLGEYLIGTLVILLVIVLVTGAIAGVLHVAKRMPSRYV